MKTPRPSRLALPAAALAALINLGVPPEADAQVLVGWNNLGMHCMDDDYSVFSILPPFNTIDAQLIDAGGRLVLDPAGIVVTYEGIADPDGSINTTTTGKSNFWDYSSPLFGASLAPEAGLTGKRMPGPGNEPQPMDFDAVRRWFEAAGVPITPIDDAGRRNPYPLLRLTAKTTGGTVLATTDIVAPVSSEMDCRACHGSGAGPAARPDAGWVDQADPSRDYRLNILRLHDERHLGSALYSDSLAAAGYPAEGLEASVRDHARPVLCAACHASEALETGGFPGVAPLTSSVHALHAGVIAPDSGLPLDDVANRSSCYQCHPGSQTRCLRGAMGASVAANGTAAMQCQSCHGGMTEVGDPGRTGWLDEPNCGSCHTGTATQNRGQLRFTSVFLANGTVRQPLLDTFSSNPDTPAEGFSLYRFSQGHGGLQCSACHGSTHAEYPAIHRNDNLQNLALQGHAGTLASCTACHGSMPRTATKGPHGMHSTDTRWAKDHADTARSLGIDSCRNCHGPDDRGTPLSRVFTDHVISTKYGTRTFRAGREVSCYDCHHGVRESDPSRRTKPVVTNAFLEVPDGTASGAVVLSATGSNPEFRILRQPAHGMVALEGALATYFPDPGFAGPDSFTFTASDGGGYVDAWEPGIVSVRVGDPAIADASDRDGDDLPDLVEYSLGFSPDFPTSAEVWMPAFRDVGGTEYWTYRILRSPSPADASPFIEFSSDGLDWVPGVVLTDDPFLLEVRDPEPAASHPRRLTRLRGIRNTEGP